MAHQCVHFFSDLFYCASRQRAVCSPAGSSNCAGHAGLCRRITLYTNWLSLWLDCLAIAVVPGHDHQLVCWTSRSISERKQQQYCTGLGLLWSFGLADKCSISSLAGTNAGTASQQCTSAFLTTHMAHATSW